MAQCFGQLQFGKIRIMEYLNSHQKRRSDGLKVTLSSRDRMKKDEDCFGSLPTMSTAEREHSHSRQDCQVGRNKVTEFRIETSQDDNQWERCRGIEVEKCSWPHDSIFQIQDRLSSIQYSPAAFLRVREQDTTSKAIREWLITPDPSVPQFDRQQPLKDQKPSGQQELKVQQQKYQSPFHSWFSTSSGHTFSSKFAKKGLHKVYTSC